MPAHETTLQSLGLRADHFTEDTSYGMTRDRGTREWLIIYTHRGRGLIHDAVGTEHRVARHDAALLHPEHAHAYHTDPQRGRWDFGWAHFDPPSDWRPWFDFPEHASGTGLTRIALTNPRARQAVGSHLGEAARLQRGTLRHRRPLMLSAIASALLWCRESLPSATQRPIDPRIQQAMEWISEHFDQPIATADIAAAAALSPSRLSHLFQQQADCTPQQYVEQRRMDRARDLLELGTHSVQQIAGMVGYNCPFYFSQRFRKAVGRCPTAYQRSIQGA